MKKEIICDDCNKKSNCPLNELPPTKGAVELLKRIFKGKCQDKIKEEEGE